MYDIATMLNFSAHTLKAIRKTDATVTANDDSCQKIMGDNTFIWPIYRPTSNEFNAAQQETVRFHATKLLEAVETKSTIVIFPLEIHNGQWVFGRLSLVDNKVQLMLIDLFGIIKEPNSEAFKMLMPIDVITASGLTCEITFDAQNGTVPLEPSYSGAIVLYLLKQYFTTGHCHLLTSLPPGVVLAHGHLINKEYQYTEDNIYACLTAILASAGLRIGTHGIICHADSSSPYRVNEYLMAISDLLKIGVPKFEADAKLNAFIGNVQGLLAANVAPEKYVICFPIGINHNHWSTGTLTIETTASTDTKIISKVMLMVHDTLYPMQHVNEYAKSIFTDIVARLQQNALVKETAIGHVQPMAASMQPDIVSCGTLTVLALDACIFRKPFRLNAKYTESEILQLRADHLNLLRDTRFPDEQLRNQPDFILSQPPKTSSLINHETIVELMEHLKALAGEEKIYFERISKEFLKAKATQDWSDSYDDRILDKLKILNDANTDEQVVALRKEICSVADPAGAMNTATTNLKAWFKQRMDAGNKVPAHDMLFSEKLYQGELQWNIQSSADMRSTMLAMLETIYIPMPETKESEGQELMLEYSDDDEMYIEDDDDEMYIEDDDELIKHQSVKIDGYSFSGTINSKYAALFHGTEMITINGLQFTYTGGFNAGNRAIGGKEVNTVLELGFPTIYDGEYTADTGEFDAGTIVCMIGGKVEIPKQSPLEADYYVLYEGEVIEGYAEGPGKLFLVTLDSCKAPVKTLILEAEFNIGLPDLDDDGLPDLDEVTTDNIKKDPKLKAAYAYYLDHFTDLRMHVNPGTKDAIHRLRAAAEEKIRIPTAAASSFTSLTPYRQGLDKRKRTASLLAEPEVVDRADTELLSAAAFLASLKNNGF